MLVGAEQNMKDWRQAVARSRIDYRWLADGRVQARLTLTFAGNTTFKFQAEADPRVFLALMQEAHPEVGFSLKGILKGVKKIAKKVASSKVFALASKALAVVSPLMGPLAPALAGASLAMGATTKLLAAKSLKKKGNTAGAKKLVAAAAADAARTPDPSPGVAAPHPSMVLDAAHAHANKVYTLLLKPA